MQKYSKEKYTQAGTSRKDQTGSSEDMLINHVNKQVHRTMTGQISEEIPERSANKHARRAKIGRLSENALEESVNNHILLSLIQHRPPFQRRLCR